jgi:hypothetical protein
VAEVDVLHQLVVVHQVPAGMKKRFLGRGDQCPAEGGS